MPRNPFRRKSSTNVLEDVPANSTPPASSFRVLERPEKINLNGDSAATGGARPVTRPFNSPLANLRNGRSVEELGAGLNRGSGGTIASGSSGYYDSSSASARHSSTSTLPSSVDAEREPEEDELFPRKVKTTPAYHNVSLDDNEQPLPPQSFATRSARAQSFGQQGGRGAPPRTEASLPRVPPKSSGRSSPQKRERAMTTSSYASTAKPDTNAHLGTSDSGSEFEALFEKTWTGDRFSDALSPPLPAAATFHRTESPPMFPQRAHSRDNFRTSPELPKEPGSPYSWDRRGSKDRLMLNSHEGSPVLPTPTPPPLPPPHRTKVAAAFLGQPKDGYSYLPQRSSNPMSPTSPTFPQENPLAYLAGHIHERDDELEGKEIQPKDHRWGARNNQRDTPTTMSTKSSTSELSKTQTRGPSVYTPTGTSRIDAQTPSRTDGSETFFGSESRNSTPRAARVEMTKQEDESLFDSSPLGPPSRAIRPQQSHGEGSVPKRMTKAQFERLQRRGDESGEPSDEEVEKAAEQDEYEDLDIDEAERARQLAKQRQKQEANMSVYRQQMKKVTGGGGMTDLPSSLARPNMERASASAPSVSGSIHLGGIGGNPPAEAFRGKQSDDDDDDVPLGILQAHGFPSASRPPTRSGEPEAAHSRRASIAGSVAGGASVASGLPAFARRLPQDPYFGSSIVNQPTRESLGMSGTPPIPPMPQMMSQPQLSQPGGLVGVIAGEERARAARRGSPNMATGAFGPAQVPRPGSMGQMSAAPGMPPRAMSMGNIAPPQVFAPSGFPPNPMMGMGMPMMGQMPQPPMMQGQQQDQVQQFMAMQMQFMQNMLAMQQQQMGQTPPATQQPPAPDYLSVPGQTGNRATWSNTTSQAPSVKSFGAGPHGRSMTMTSLSPRWELPQPGPRPNSANPQTYAPSGLNISNGNGPVHGYTPSIAPSERSNVGMPSRYRPITMVTDEAGRTRSITSSTKARASTTPNTSLDVPQTQAPPLPKTTIRAVDKPKGLSKIIAKAATENDNDDDEGWADMHKKREDRKTFRFGKKSKGELSMEELYQNLS